MNLVSMLALWLFCCFVTLCINVVTDHVVDVMFTLIAELRFRTEEEDIPNAVVDNCTSRMVLQLLDGYT